MIFMFERIGLKYEKIVSVHHQRLFSHLYNPHVQMQALNYVHLVRVILPIMALPVMEFQDQGYKIRKIFA